MDGGELTNTAIFVCDGNLDKEKESFGLGVVILLEIGGDGLDLLSVCCEAKTPVSKARSMVRGRIDARQWATHELDCP